MKKIYAIYLVGLMLIFSYVFNNSIYEIYGLNNIGDTSLTQYQISDTQGENLLKVYKELTANNAKFQIVKTPISGNDKIYYDIYHTDIDSIKKIVGVSNNIYRYFKMTQDDFVDSSGLFSTNLPSGQIKMLSQKIGINIKMVENQKIAYSDILKQNALQFVILCIITFAIIYIYTIFRYKVNSVKKLVGFSPVKIVFTNIKETVQIQSACIAIVVCGYAIYYYFNNKLSLRYLVFLTLFLIIISSINILLILLLQRYVKGMDIIAALKNKVFSSRLNYIIHVIKIILIIFITVSINMSIKYYGNLQELYKKCDTYKALNNMYTSNGFNSDEYDRLRSNKKELTEAHNNVKKMYVENKDKAYVMKDLITPYLKDKSFEEELGQTREQMVNSYERNKLILNRKYIEDYTGIKIDWNFNQSIPTILVPEKYKQDEKEIKAAYIETYNLYLNNISKDDSEISENNIKDIQIIYIPNGIKYNILSSIYNEDTTDIVIHDSIIILDNGSFKSSFYYDNLTNCSIAFKLNDRDQFKSMLIRYNLDKIYNASTMLRPFEMKISNYKFLMEQANIFIFLFVLVLLFIVYISNYIDMVVNSKKYGAQYIQGYSAIKILNANIITTVIMIAGSIVLYILKINFIYYLLFIAYDLIMLLVLYRKIIVNDLYKIINGGC
ncbi:hypothetical protein [Clostridium manihotivorum]|uniref:DUF1430 domain-containing protein n=1 Tax=Clostridium manihotivorum TaxID=2320868 RepID=A0A410DTA7_9CLOT|nr:hypothetical protein [Clostridium manihotivorum]QAA32238.1 hypothetical protein C1I91_11640 [Clostridium manihotivorum]